MAEAMCREMLREPLGFRMLWWIRRQRLGRRSQSNVLQPAQAKLREKRVPIGEHRARQLTRADYNDCDWLIGMDAANMRNMARIAAAATRSAEDAPFAGALRRSARQCRSVVHGRF